MRRAGYRDAIPVAIGDCRDISQRLAGGDLDKDFLAFTPHNDVAAELFQGGGRSDRAMRSNRHGRPAAGPEMPKKVARHAEFGLGAAPEQISGGGGDDRHVRSELSDERSP